MITPSIQDKEGIPPEDPAMAVAGAAAAAAACVAISANELKAMINDDDDDKAHESLTEDGEMVDFFFGRLVCIITSTAKFFNVKKTKIFR